MTHIFISYSKQDIDFARYLRTLLESSGLRVWIDEERIESGGRWWKIIESNIDVCAAFLVIMSPHAEESDWVEREILRAELKKKPIYPVLLTGDSWSRLANIQYEDFRIGLHAKLSARFIGRLQAHLPASFAKPIEFTIQQGDIRKIEADVVALKYSREFRGADMMVALQLAAVAGIAQTELQPAIGEYAYVETLGAIAAHNVFFYGMEGPRLITYQLIRDLATKTLGVLGEIAPETRHLAMTIHGPNFGLDEVEALLSQFAGYMDALESSEFPSALEKITIVEWNGDRVKRLREALQPHLDEASYAELLKNDWGYRLSISPEGDSSEPDGSAIETAGTQPRTSVYVAMPANDTLDDVFYYGIQSPVHAHGLLCERLDHQTMNEDALTQAKSRIDSAAVVVADLTGADPTVHLQVGYAWGKARPTILILQKGHEARLEGHQCIVYDKIRDIESKIAEALNGLKSEGLI